MTGRLKKTAIIVVAVLAAAQFIRPDRTNPPTDATRAIAARVGTGTPWLLD